MIESKNHVKVLKPRIPNELFTFELSEDNISDYDSISTVLINECRLENHKAKKVSFKETLFKNVIFDNVSLEYSELTDIRFENCDLSNVNFIESSIHRVEFVNCKMVGINLSESTMRNVVFNQCNGQYSFFRFTDCKQVVFGDCRLRSSDFQESKFCRVEFKNTDMTQIQMHGTKLEGMDLCSCDIDGMGARVEDVIGVIVTPAQAISLASLMGIVIKE